MRVRRGAVMPRADLKLVPDDDGLLLPEVKATLAGLKNEPPHKHSVDRAMHRLALAYATTIDEARIVALNARDLIAEANKEDGLEIAKRTLNALVKFSESNAVLSDLGPRLQSVLETLGASPKARAAMVGSRGGGKLDDAAPKPQSPLERRRAAAAERESRARQHGSSSLDATTT